MFSTQDDDDPNQIEVYKEDTIGAQFEQKCYIRPAYTFAASERRMGRKLCSLKPEKLNSVLDALHGLIDQ